MEDVGGIQCAQNETTERMRRRYARLTETGETNLYVIFDALADEVRQHDHALLLDRAASYRRDAVALRAEGQPDAAELSAALTAERDAFKAKWHAAMDDGDGQALTRLELHGQIDALTAERDALAAQVTRVRELAQQAEPKHDQYEFAQAVLAALDGTG